MGVPISFIREDTTTPEERAAQIAQLWESTEKLRELMVAVGEAGGMQISLNAFDGDEEREEVAHRTVPGMIESASHLADMIEFATFALQDGDFFVAAGLLSGVAMAAEDLARISVIVRPQWQDKEIEVERQRQIAEALAESAENMLKSGVEINVADGIETVGERPVCDDCGHIHPTLTVFGEKINLDDGARDFDDLDFPDEVKGMLAGLLNSSHDVEVTDIPMPEEMREAMLADGGIDGSERGIAIHASPIGGGVGGAA